MTRVLRPIIAGTFALGLAACHSSTDAGPESGRLADLQINDPTFTFATSRTVSLEVQVTDREAPQMIEVSDAEGRRLVQGAFLTDTKLDLKVPLGQAETFTVRSGQGDTATEQTVTIDADGRAIAKVR